MVDGTTAPVSRCSSQASLGGAGDLDVWFCLCINSINTIQSYPIESEAYPIGKRLLTSLGLTTSRGRLKMHCECQTSIVWDTQSFIATEEQNQQT